MIHIFFLQYPYYIWQKETVAERFYLDVKQNDDFEKNPSMN